MHTLLVGFDSFDPSTFERLSSEGKMPNLTKYVEAGNYSHLQVSDPPQTEVSWSSIATGLDPGWHGVFDFVHRNPKTYTPFASLLATKKTTLGVQFIPPVKANTIFEQAVKDGYPATTLWWPATFPAKPESTVRTIPGLGAPDILGRLGVGTLFTTNTSFLSKNQKTPVKSLHKKRNGVFLGSLDGPAQKKGKSTHESSLDFQLEMDLGDNTGKLLFGKKTIPLITGKWSSIFEVTFKMGLFFSVRAITQVILIKTNQEISLYFLPLQIHPISSIWRYGTPPAFIKQSWKTAGPFLSLGWPQDTTALEEHILSDEQFLDLCESIFLSREKLFMHHLESFNEGLFGAVFDSLDRIQHMFRRDRHDIIELWYGKLDKFVGRVEYKLSQLGQEDIKLFFLSDHGFSEFDYKVHLNYWLTQNGYLNFSGNNQKTSIRNADWTKSSAYAIGLNSIYINQHGREGQGIIKDDEYHQILERIRSQLEEWKGVDGKRVVQRVLCKDEIYSGPLKDSGPDIIIGYSPGYRASSETGLGDLKMPDIEPNTDHWGADHCIDSHAVPAVIFSNQSLKEFSSPSFRDIPMLTIGKKVEQRNRTPPNLPPAPDEDEEIIEERLKSLGYL